MPRAFVLEDRAMSLRDNAGLLYLADLRKDPVGIFADACAAKIFARVAPGLGPSAVLLPFCSRMDRTHKLLIAVMLWLTKTETVRPFRSHVAHLAQNTFSGTRNRRLPNTSSHNQDFRLQVGCDGKRKSDVHA